MFLIIHEREPNHFYDTEVANTCCLKSFTSFIGILGILGNKLVCFLADSYLG